MLPRPIRHAPPTGQGARSRVDRRQRQRRLWASPGRLRRRPPALARHLLGQRAPHPGRPIHVLALATARPSPGTQKNRSAPGSIPPTDQPSTRTLTPVHVPPPDQPVNRRLTPGVVLRELDVPGIALFAIAIAGLLAFLLSIGRQAEWPLLLRCRWGRRAVDPPRVRASDALSGRAFPAAQPPHAGPVRAIRRGQPDLLRGLLRLPALAAAGTAARAGRWSAWSCCRSRVRRSC